MWIIVTMRWKLFLAFAATAVSRYLYISLCNVSLRRNKFIFNATLSILKKKSIPHIPNFNSN